MCWCGGCDVNFVFQHTLHNFDSCLYDAVVWRLWCELCVSAYSPQLWQLSVWCGGVGIVVWTLCFSVPCGCQHDAVVCECYVSACALCFSAYLFSVLSVRWGDGTGDVTRTVCVSAHLCTTLFSVRMMQWCECCWNTSSTWRLKTQTDTQHSGWLWNRWVVLLLGGGGGGGGVVLCKAFTEI